MRKTSNRGAWIAGALVSLLAATEALGQGSIPPGGSGRIEEVPGTATKYEWKVPKEIGGGLQLIFIRRDGDIVTFEFTTNAIAKPNVKTTLTLAKLDGVKTTVPHKCRETPVSPKVDIAFNGEAFERIVPPNTPAPPATPVDPVQPLTIVAAEGKTTFLIGKLALHQGSGRFYVNGLASQVVTDWKSTFKQKITGKTFVWTPKASPEYTIEGQKVTPTSLPRFDVKRAYPAQFRVFHEQAGKRIHVAVVSIDTPGIVVDSASRVWFDAGRMAVDDEATLEMSLSNYLFEDQEAILTPDLPTHRFDWTVRAEFKYGNLFATSKGKSVQDADTTVAPDPATGANTAYGEALTNDPGTDGGWNSVPGQLDRKQQ
ncbi:MAG: hypothetical protein HYY17_10945 [Planctomycetes bacterium]|nr:hypothetical protein [Planctomycetota bacterium]